MKYISKKYLLLALLSFLFLYSGCLMTTVKRGTEPIVLAEDQSPLSRILTQCMKESNPILMQAYLHEDVRMKNDYGEEAFAEWEVLSDLSLFFEEHLYSNFWIDYQVISADKRSEIIAGQYTDTETNIYNVIIHAEEGRIYKINISNAPIHVPSACDFFNCNLETI